MVLEQARGQVEEENHPGSVSCSLQPRAPDMQTMKLVFMPLELKYKQGLRNLEWAAATVNY